MRAIAAAILSGSLFVCWCIERKESDEPMYFGVAFLVIAVICGIYGV